MDFIIFIWEFVVPFLVVLSVLIFVHEMGHFLVARWAGVKVEVFSIGFGSELRGYTDRYGTRWRLAAVPLGGYVKMFGEGDLVSGVDDTEERPMTDEEKKVSFHHKPLFKRTAIVAAGPLANFAFSVIILGLLSGTVGLPKLQNLVGTVVENSAAEAAGLKAGDRIVSIDGRAVRWFDDLVSIVSLSAGKPLELEIERADTVLFVIATPRSITNKQYNERVLQGKDGFDDLDDDEDDEDDDERLSDDDDEEEDHDEAQEHSRGLLGVTPDYENIIVLHQGPLDAVLNGFTQTYAMTAQTLNLVGEIFEGDRSAKELGGVLAIAETSGRMAQVGLAGFLTFMALLSVNLGLINLFPIPVLDGGHLVFYAFEALRGRPLSLRVQEYGFRLGLVLVLLLMIFATWNDVERLLERFWIG